VGDEPIPGTRSAISSPPSTPDNPTASTPRSRSRRRARCCDTPQDRRGDFEGRGIGDPQAAFEAALDPEPIEPFGDPPAAAVDENDRRRRATAATSPSTCRLIGDGGPSQLDDKNLAHGNLNDGWYPRTEVRGGAPRRPSADVSRHVVYSEFSMT